MKNLQKIHQKILSPILVKISSLNHSPIFSFPKKNHQKRWKFYRKFIRKWKWAHTSKIWPLMAVWNFFTHANPLPPTPPSMVKDRTFPLCFGTLPSEDFHGVRNWTSLVDRTHWKNHQACHLGYNMDLYPQLKGVNSQQAEQINRSLRSLSVVLASQPLTITWESLNYILCTRM